MGAAEKMKTIHVASVNKRLPLQIWDITGNEKFRTLTSIYFRDADAAILVCDVTDKKSFENLKDMWFKEMKSLGPENIIVYILGNKTDAVQEMPDDTDPVSVGMIKEFAMRRKAEFHMVSARKNQGIDEVFQRLGERLINQAPSENKRRGSILLEDDERNLE